MRLLFFTFLFVLGTYAISHASRVEDPQAELKQHMNAVLGHRVQSLVQTRTQFLEEKVSYTRHPEVSDFVSHAKRILIKGQYRGRYTVLDEMSMVALLDLFQDSERLMSAADVKKVLRQADYKVHHQARKKFDWFVTGTLAYKFSPLDDVVDFFSGDPAGTDASEKLKLYFKLDPWCATNVLPSYKSGVLEINPCHALDYDISRTVATTFHLKSSADWAQWVDRYVNTLWQSMVAVPSGVSLLKVAQDGGGSQASAVASSALFEFAAKPAAGYIDGFSDQVWKNGAAAHEASSDILKNYHAFKLALDSYRYIVSDWAPKNYKGILAFAGYSIAQLNRHDFVSTYMSCTLRTLDMEDESSELPILVGKIYESLDFVSHLKEGVSLKDSFRNFKADTNRYRLGTRIAKRICTE